jgi:hypothetical protein
MLINPIPTLVALTLIALGTPAALAQTPTAAGLISERSISLNTAMELATTSLERCRAAAPTAIQ